MNFNNQEIKEIIKQQDARLFDMYKNRQKAKGILTKVKLKTRVEMQRPVLNSSLT